MAGTVTLGASDGRSRTLPCRNAPDLNPMLVFCARWNPPRLRQCALQLACLATLVFPALAQQAAAPILPPQPNAPITLSDAIAEARANEPSLAAAVATSKNAGLDRSIARAALLPDVTYNNQFLYSQANHCPTTNKICAANAGVDSAQVSAPVRFIANNEVHEYISQGSVTETIGAQQFNAVSRASTSLAVAKAELEVAQRGWLPPLLVFSMRRRRLTGALWWPSGPPMRRPA